MPRLQSTAGRLWPLAQGVCVVVVVVFAAAVGVVAVAVAAAEVAVVVAFQTYCPYKPFPGPGLRS